MHFWKAYTSAVNLGYLETILVHPTMRQIAVNSPQHLRSCRNLFMRRCFLHLCWYFLVLGERFSIPGFPGLALKKWMAGYGPAVQ